MLGEIIAGIVGFVIDVLLFSIVDSILDPVFSFIGYKTLKILTLGKYQKSGKNSNQLFNSTENWVGFFVLLGAFLLFLLIV